MCSIEEPVMLAPPKPTHKICTKCKTAQAVVTLRHSPFCQPCFEFLFVGKYRTVINQSKPIQSKLRIGKVLLAVSGGHSSLAMLELTAGFSFAPPEQKKKIHTFGSVSVCHIDESSLFEGSESTIPRISEMMESKYSIFPYHCEKLEDVFGPEYTESQSFSEILEIASKDLRPGQQEISAHLNDIHQSKLTNAEKLRALFQHIGKNSAREDIYWHLKMNMLYRRAQKEKCDFIFLGESSTRQAIKMISMTSKGRGYSAALDVGSDNTVTYQNMAIIRPMKDMLAKEIAVYNRNHNIDGFVIPTTNWSTKATSKSSIERLTEEFITGLDRDFPSTVSTVSRTASKLTVSNDLDIANKCAICLMPIQRDITGWRDRITVMTLDKDRKEVLKKDDSNISGAGECCGGSENANCCSDTPTKTCCSSTQSIPFLNFLCYSCQVDARDYKAGQFDLPPYVAEVIKSKDRDERLRQQVQEFLLSDDDE
ncbi:unnamed protein product [Umbelopsis ramanniana]